MEVLPCDLIGHQPGRFAVQAIDLLVLALQEPLAEVLESGQAAGAVAGEDFPRILGPGVLTIGASASQAEDPPGSKRQMVIEEGVQLLFEDLACLLHHIWSDRSQRNGQP